MRCLNSGIHAVACADAKLVRIPANHPAGLSSTHPSLQRAPVEQRASCAYFSEEPDQKQSKSGASLLLSLLSF
jgi:hypothetical protein